MGTVTAWFGKIYKQAVQVFQTPARIKAKGKEEIEMYTAEKAFHLNGNLYLN